MQHRRFDAALVSLGLLGNDAVDLGRPWPECVRSVPLMVNFDVAAAANEVLRAAIRVMAMFFVSFCI